MALRPQIELSKENVKKLCSIKERCSLNLSLTMLANQAVTLGMPRMVSNLYNARIFRKGKK